MWVKGIRGGNWNNASNAGVFNLNLNNLRSNVNTNIGFRVACAWVIIERAFHGMSSSVTTHRQALDPCRKAKIVQALHGEYG